MGCILPRKTSDFENGGIWIYESCQRRLSVYENFFAGVQRNSGIQHAIYFISIAAQLRKECCKDLSVSSIKGQAMFLITLAVLSFLVQ